MLVWSACSTVCSCPPSGIKVCRRLACKASSFQHILNCLSDSSQIVQDNYKRKINMFRSITQKCTTQFIVDIVHCLQFFKTQYFGNCTFFCSKRWREGHDSSQMMDIVTHTHQKLLGWPGICFMSSKGNKTWLHWVIECVVLVTQTSHCFYHQSYNFSIEKHYFYIVKFHIISYPYSSKE